MNLRKGVEADLPRILSLVKELAEYEKAPAEVEVTIEEMLNWGFGKDKLFEFYVLEKENLPTGLSAEDKAKAGQAGMIVGMALYYYKYSTWKGKCLFLEDIIITEKERQNGYGKLLFNEIVKVAKAQKVRRMEWQVLDWNKPALEFYKKYNSNLDGEWINCKLTFDQLQTM